MPCGRRPRLLVLKYIGDVVENGAVAHTDQNFLLGIAPLGFFKADIAAEYTALLADGNADACIICRVVILL